MEVMRIPEGAWKRWRKGELWTETHTLLPVGWTPSISCSVGRVHRTCGEKKHHVDTREKEIIELASQPGVSQVSKLIRGDWTDKLKRELISSHLENRPTNTSPFRHYSNASLFLA